MSVLARTIEADEGRRDGERADEFLHDGIYAWGSLGRLARNVAVFVLAYVTWPGLEGRD